MMNRGDLVTIAMQGDWGKPRPALAIQSDPFNEHATVTVLLVSSTLVDAPLFRVTVQPDKSAKLDSDSNRLSVPISPANSAVVISPKPGMDCSVRANAESAAVALMCDPAF